MQAQSKMHCCDFFCRFFTRAEQEHLALIDRERIGKQAQRSSSTWASVTPNQRAAFKKHLIQQQQQQQQVIA